MYLQISEVSVPLLHSECFTKASQNLHQFVIRFQLRVYHLENLMSVYLDAVHRGGGRAIDIALPLRWMSIMRLLYFKTTTE